MGRHDQRRRRPDVVFKLLVNDITWSSGTDLLVEPGASLTLEPTF